ncbi:catechol 2,3-dioxygenase-like lactoylglutathione lyase family enzyme [Microbacterium terrae]|uniref:Bleomycin resistance protein n=1 Tax=Microbacterium terrae TaxID=69369 RepID=A0A0M2H6E2_9MICO|nr:VOC family protein [Microbacterium terrae]KJL40147.1 Bleomycin resistance protein [Microbacterium terrae]MBP1079291.1 catechol 2,3-dioxygenase-like lactoylglutathione lyase family enzyme [Microbacterium terrae]GLJ98690.1 bleomycin resistance protein [Microbacterium terrae]
MTDTAVPILPSRDLAETLAFYEALGFENRGAPPEVWDYLIIGRGDAMLHFFSHADVDPLSTAAQCYLYVSDAPALHAEWSAVVQPDPPTGSRITDVAATDYGMHEFAVVDRSGNLVRVGSMV